MAPFQGPAAAHSDIPIAKSPANALMENRATLALQVRPESARAGRLCAYKGLIQRSGAAAQLMRPPSRGRGCLARSRWFKLVCATGGGQVLGARTLCCDVCVGRIMGAGTGLARAAALLSPADQPNRLQAWAQRPGAGSGSCGGQSAAWTPAPVMRARSRRAGAPDLNGAPSISLDLDAVARAVADACRRTSTGTPTRATAVARWP
jgi:hypothetical protein